MRSGSYGFAFTYRFSVREERGTETRAVKAKT
jgi:hypothetical protein